MVVHDVVMKEEFDMSVLLLSPEDCKAGLADIGGLSFEVEDIGEEVVGWVVVVEGGVVKGVVVERVVVEGVVVEGGVAEGVVVVVKALVL